MRPAPQSAPMAFANCSPIAMASVKAIGPAIIMASCRSSNSAQRKHYLFDNIRFPKLTGPTAREQKER